MIEGIVLIITVFLVTPALIFTYDEIKHLKYERDWYKNYYEETRWTTRTM